MGADVVRVERPVIHNVTASLTGNPFDVYNRNKRSVALDLKQSHDLKILVKMVERADVLIEGFRPGVTERLGIGPKECLDANQKLIYGRMTGWGQSGPLSLEAGHDINYLAITGALHAIGTKERPVPPLNLVGDFGGGGAMLAFGIASAMLHAMRTGKGQVIDAAMSDGAAYLMSPFYARTESGSFVEEREGNLLDGGAPHYGVYCCADGKFISVGPLEPQFWASFLQLIGLEGDPQFHQRDDRSKWPFQRARLTQCFVQRTRDEWCEILEGKDACVAPVLTLKEAPDHPHNAARQTFINVNGARVPAPAPRFSLADRSVAPAAMNDDQTVASILEQAGFSAHEVTLLRNKGTLG
jgi:alpha-methylacyl-CoA racemase